MKTLLRLIAIQIILSVALLPGSAAQTLIESYTPKVVGKPYHGMTADNEGNILVYQHFDHVNGEFVGTLAKLGPDGKSVAGFNKVITDGVIGHVEIQKDGKILLTGNFSTINGNVTPNFVRLNPDGTPDPSFNSALDRAGVFKLQSDGKIIVIQAWGLVRLNTDGSIDPTFSMSGSFYLNGPLAVGPDDHIYFTTYSQVYRLKPDGADDTDFYVGSGVNQNHITAIAVQADGKILLGGFFSEYNGIARNSLVRLMPNGQVDIDFSIGEGPNGQVLCIHPRANNNILIAGVFSQYNKQPASLVELKPEGSLQRIIAVVSTNYITSIDESPDGRMTIGGEFSRVNGMDVSFLVKFNADYTINNSFKPLVTYNNPNGRFLEVKDDGKLLTGANLDFDGIFQGSEVVKKEIVQMNALGIYDKTFSPRFPADNPYIVSSLVQDDGKILLGGVVQDFNQPNLVRLNADGTKDNSFQIGTGPGTDSNLAGMIYEMKKKDDVLYFGGYFSKYNGVASQSFVAVDMDGTIVKTSSALPAESQIDDFDFQSDGKIIIIGGFPFAGESKRILRLNPDGTLDDSFALTSFTGNLLVVRTDSLDRIYLGGSFMNVNGALANSLVRLLPDGNLDTSFDIRAGFDDNVYGLEFLPGGNIAVGGYFRVFDDQEANGFVILDQGGMKVETPSISFGKNSVIVKMKRNNGALYLAGRFLKPDYSDAYGMAKISLDPVTVPKAPDNLSVAFESDHIFRLTWHDNSHNELAFILERSIDSESAFVVYDTLDVNSVSTLDHQVEAHVPFFYRLKAVGDGGQSEYSNVASIEWVTAPTAQLSLTVTEQNDNELLLTWTGNVEHHDGFIVERSEVQNSGYMPLDTVSANTYAYVDVVELEKTYFYRVDAYNRAGRKSSNEVTSIISGIGSDESIVSVFPIPADRFIYTRTDLSTAGGRWRLVSTTGQSIALTISELSHGVSAMNVQDVPPGIYIAQYSNGNRILYNRRITIHH